mmetsp:Transcript_21552/g.19122  ORF Transcript_21552/g.19122 Transcript_21552/m.19122 type:complete len:120 (+) Transcript_21552:413-772(+)
MEQGNFDEGVHLNEDSENIFIEEKLEKMKVNKGLYSPPEYQLNKHEIFSGCTSLNSPNLSNDTPKFSQKSRKALIVLENEGGTVGLREKSRVRRDVTKEIEMRIMEKLHEKLQQKKLQL